MHYCIGSIALLHKSLNTTTLHQNTEKIIKRIHDIIWYIPAQSDPFAMLYTEAWLKHRAECLDLTSERPKESPERKPDNSWGAMGEGASACRVRVESGVQSERAVVHNSSVNLDRIYRMVSCVRFMGIVYPGLGWAHYRVRERHPMVFYDWGTWFGVTLWYVYVSAYPMVFYCWGTQGYGGGSVVWRGEGDLGAIGCVSIKTCHNSCRGIIAERGGWRSRISTLWSANFVMISLQISRREDKAWWKNKKHPTRHFQLRVWSTNFIMIRKGVEEYKMQPTNIKTTNSPFSTPTAAFSEQSQPWKWQSL